MCFLPNLVATLSHLMYFFGARRHQGNSTQWFSLIWAQFTWYPSDRTFGRAFSHIPPLSHGLGGFEARKFPVIGPFHVIRLNYSSFKIGQKGSRRFLKSWSVAYWGAWEQFGSQVLKYCRDSHSKRNKGQERGIGPDSWEESGLGQVFSKFSKMWQETYSFQSHLNLED